MADVPKCLDLQQGGAVTGASSRDRVVAGLLHGHHVLTIHLDAGHVVARRALAQIGDGGSALDGGTHAIAVVLNDEDRRELPESSDVQRFVERADVGRRLAEVGHRDLIGAAIPGGEREAGAERDLATDDAVSSHEMHRHVEQVHRAALALRASRCLAEQFGHDRARRHAAGQRLPVFAVGADHVVVGTQRGERADRDRFLPDIEVAEAADLSQ